MRLKRLAWVLWLAAGCQSREVTPKVTGTEYFPLQVGTFWLYDVVETTITQLGGQTNSIYELKIEVTDSITTVIPTSYILQQYKRADASQPWQAAATWSARKDQFSAIIQEGNIPYIKLSFPLSEQKSWNANALNNLGGNDVCLDGTTHCDNYLSENLMKRFEGNGFSYDDSVTILENNDDDPIVMKDVRKAVYARSVGLIYREHTILSYCTQGACAGQKIVENGFIFKQSIKSYGRL